MLVMPGTRSSPWRWGCHAAAADCSGALRPRDHVRVVVCRGGPLCADGLSGPGST